MAALEGDDRAVLVVLPSHDGTKPSTVSTMPGAGASSTFLAAAATESVVNSVKRDCIIWFCAAEGVSGWRS